MKKIFLIILFSLLSTPGETQTDRDLEKISGHYRYQSIQTNASLDQDVSEIMNEDILDINTSAGELKITSLLTNETVILPFKKSQDSKLIFSTLIHQEIPPFREEQGTLEITIDPTSHPMTMQRSYVGRKTLKNKDSQIIETKELNTIHEGTLDPNISQFEIQAADLVGIDKDWTLLLKDRLHSTSRKQEIRFRYHRGENHILFLDILIRSDNAEFKSPYELGKLAVSYFKKIGRGYCPSFSFVQDDKKYSYVICFSQNQKGEIIGEGVYRIVKGEIKFKNNSPHFPYFSPSLKTPLEEEGTLTLTLKNKKP